MRTAFFRDLPSAAALLVLTCSSFSIPSETVTRSYGIIYQGEKIGTVNLLRQTKQRFTYINLQTSARVKKLFTFAISSNDEALFENGVLLWSKVYREVNGKVKEHKQTSRTDSIYNLRNAGSHTTLQGTITKSMLSLYLEEPVATGRVYSDNHQQFVGIRRLGAHTYKIDLPDGSSNTYEYTGNVCRRVSIRSQLFEVRFELEQH